MAVVEEQIHILLSGEVFWFGRGRQPSDMMYVIRRAVAHSTATGQTRWAAKMGITNTFDATDLEKGTNPSRRVCGREHQEAIGPRTSEGAPTPPSTRHTSEATRTKLPGC